MNWASPHMWSVPVPLINVSSPPWALSDMEFASPCLERLLVPLTPARLKTIGADGAVKTANVRPGEVQWLQPGTQADENTGDARYEAILLEFKK